MASASRPPGLPWHPLRQTVGWIRRPQELLDHCTGAYGDAFTLRMFGAQFTLFTSPALIKELVAQPADVMAAGKANGILAPLVGNASVLVLDGEDHLAMRRLQLPPLHGARMRTYEHSMRQIAEAGIARWPLEGTVTALPRMQSITLDIIVRVVFGIEDQKRRADVREAVRALLDAGGSRWLMVSVGVRSTITGKPPQEHTGALRKVLGAREALGQLLEAEIDARRASADEADHGDVLSLLLQARQEDGEPLPGPLIRDQLITLLVAGHETTATSLAWAVERIARHPELQERLAVEALDGRFALIDATIRETLRARPALPIFMREVQQPVQVGGYDFEPGMFVGGATMALHRRPDIYPDPEEFRPERFLGDGAPGTYEWTPFGGGVRRCLGASFALLEMRIVLSALLADRRLEPVREPAEVQRRKTMVLTPSEGGAVRAPRRRMLRTAPPDAFPRSEVR